MSSTDVNTVQPFYFKSYNEIIGTAMNVGELEKEIRRLAKENPTALEYHLRQGHIVDWLNHSSEKDVAALLKGVESVEELQNKVTTYMNDKQNLGGPTPRRRARPKKER